jgi:antitoxin component YwqK of YwqJK toxin-antitoxin module
MEGLYYFDGTILGRAFSHNGKLEGDVEAFRANGKPLAIDSFHNGVRVSRKFFKPTDSGATFFSHGKLQSLKDADVDWLLKKEQ